MNNSWKITVAAIATFLILGCSSNHRFTGFYNDHKREARLALAVPKFMVNIFIPKEDRDVVKRLTKGMKKIKVLYEHRTADALSRDLDLFIGSQEYATYFLYKDDGSRLALHAFEDEEEIHEIIMKLDANDEIVIVTLQGKMDLQDFNRALENTVNLD